VSGKRSRSSEQATRAANDVTDRPEGPLRVVPVDTRGDLKTFIDLPWKIYRGDPDWVPPLRMDVRHAFDPSKHPFHLHSEAQPYLALRGDEPVGRICAIRNRRHEEFHEEPVGFFGFFECVDDAKVAAALFDTVREWLAERGLHVMRGPASFSTNETVGLLVAGEPGPPVLMMAYNPPYYPALLEGYGFRKVKDLYAWMIEASEVATEYFDRAERAAMRRGKLVVRHLDPSRFADELELVRDLYNAAWEKNWGFVPMTDAEMDFMAKELKPFVEPKLAPFVETEDGETVGFALALPDYNAALIRMNGRLFPFGIVKALLAKRKIRTLRVLILGVRGEYRKRGVDLLMYVNILRNAQELGMRRAEMSWILEDNTAMNAPIERMGGRVYRTYRLYDIDIASEQEPLT